MLLLALEILAQTTSENIQQTESSADTGNLIHFGDLIDVDVVGSTEYDWRGNLTPEGFLDGISFVEEPIYALCRTSESVASDVAKGYEKLLKNPQVVIKIIDRSRRSATLLYGAVKTPQRFQIYRAVRLNELLIKSGGITDKANGEIQILRSPSLSCAAKKSEQKSADAENQTKISLSAAQEGGAQYINIKISDLLKGKPEANPLILSGDVVTVFESKPIYITGGVVNPRQISAREQISVTRAIDAAGGVAKNGEPNKVTIFRVENKETKIIEVDLNKIKSGQAEDLSLKAFDIVEVSQRGKSRAKYVPPPDSELTNQQPAQNLPLKIID